MTDYKYNMNQHNRVKHSFDIVFCFDCSGSMAGCIDNLRLRAETLINNFNTNVDWRVKVMGFRDANIDSEYIINNMPFVTNVEDVKKQLSSIETTGGNNDNPRSALDVMWYATKETEWRPRCHKVLIMFTDSTSHPVHQYTIDKFSILGDQEYLMQEMECDHIKFSLFCKPCEIFEDIQGLSSSYIRFFDNAQDGLNKLNNEDLEHIIRMRLPGCSPAY